MTGVQGGGSPVERSPSPVGSVLTPGVSVRTELSVQHPLVSGEWDSSLGSEVVLEKEAPAP